MPETLDIGPPPPGSNEPSHLPHPSVGEDVGRVGRSAPPEHHEEAAPDQECGQGILPDLSER